MGRMTGTTKYLFCPKIASIHLNVRVHVTYVYIYICLGVEGSGEWMNWEQYSTLIGKQLALRLASGGRVKMRREPDLDPNDNSVLS